MRLFPKLISSVIGLALWATVVDSQAVVQIVGTSVKQNIDGFGCSLAFMGEAIQSLPATPRAAILQNLFSPTSGAGLSILRTRVSPYLSSAPGQYNYTADTEEVGTRYLVTQAKALGVSRFLATVWTPPSYLKTNGNPNGGTISNSPTSFTNYAAYLSKYISTYKATYGIDWYAISPQNEPELQEDYESCQWQASDFVTFLGTYLKPRFTQDGITTSVLAAESFEWFDGMINPTLSNATSRAAVQIVAAHPYHAGEIDSNTGGIRTSGYNYFPLAKLYNKQLWATEYNNASSGADSIVDSIRIATLVHKHMTVPESNAFLFWWGAANKVETALTETLIFFNATGSYTIRKRLWALGQFARFIRPGWSRIDGTAEPQKGVHVSAYKTGSGTSTKFVIVAINENTAAASMKFNLYGLQASSVAVYRTSATENLKLIGNIAVAQGSFTSSIAAQSITTFTGNTDTNAAAFAGSPAFITEFASLAGASGASGDLVTKFYVDTIDPTNTPSSDETAILRQTNTNEYIQYPVTSTTFTRFVLSVQRNADADGLSFAAVSSGGTLTTLTATRSALTAQPGSWFLYTYTITSVPAGTQHIRIRFSATNAEWNPRLTRLVIT